MLKNLYPTLKDEVCR